jgi:hypothetical protein
MGRFPLFQRCDPLCLGGSDVGGFLGRFVSCDSGFLLSSSDENFWVN